MKFIIISSCIRILSSDGYLSHSHKIHHHSKVINEYGYWTFRSGQYFNQKVHLTMGAMWPCDISSHSKDALTDLKLKILNKIITERLRKES